MSAGTGGSATGAPPGAIPAEAAAAPVGGDLQRTRLAAERTLLAWLRSALTALAVGLTVARVVPELADEPGGPYLALGAGYCVLGLGLAGAGVMRHRALDRDAGAALSSRAVTLVASAVAALAAATLLVLLAGGGLAPL